MSGQPMTAWVFGKLPWHGDFVARGLEPAARERLDLWLSDAMLRARERLGPAFEAAYDAAPPWRFVEPANDGWTGGALCASIDAAGRRFPLMVARSADNALAATGAAQACEQSIFRAFDERGDVDALWQLATTEPPFDPPERAESGWWTDGNDAFGAARLPCGRPPELIVAMLQDTVND